MNPTITYKPNPDAEGGVEVWARDVPTRFPDATHWFVAPDGALKIHTAGGALVAEFHPDHWEAVYQVSAR